MVQNVFYFHFVRAQSILRSTEILCAAGSAAEALVLVRSLVNLHINLKWILSSDTEARAQRFADFEMVFRKQLSDAYHKYRGTQPSRDFNYVEKENAVLAILNKYTKKAKRTNRKVLSWSGIQIAQMARDSGTSWDYDIFYSKLSSIEHTCPSSVEHYWDGKTLTSLPRPTGVPLTLFAAIDYFTSVGLNACKVLGAPYTDFSFLRISLEKTMDMYSQRGPLTF